MARSGRLWQHFTMTSRLRHPHWVFAIAALALWVALGWPVVQAMLAGAEIRFAPVSPLWFVPFVLLGASLLCAMTMNLPPRLQSSFLALQIAAIMAMAIIVPWAMMAVFLILTAWQIAMLTSPARALALVGVQTLAVIGALGLAPDPDFCWILGLAAGLQLCVLFTAHAMRSEAETARALAETNHELRSAQAIIASTARDAERLRISRELHDAWGHELTALGLQLEIASHVTEPGRANDHVIQARGLAGELLAKVRDVVSTLREDERCDLKGALEALAQNVPTPTIHVQVAPGLRVGPDQVHALIRCAQEAVTNAIRHAEASNLWLQVTSVGGGVRLIARNDGSPRPIASSPGSGLAGMRERVECLGGRLAVRTGADAGFTIDAWLPAHTSRAA